MWEKVVKMPRYATAREVKQVTVTEISHVPGLIWLERNHRKCRHVMRRGLWMSYYWHLKTHGQFVSNGRLKTRWKQWVLSSWGWHCLQLGAQPGDSPKELKGGEQEESRFHRKRAVLNFRRKYVIFTTSVPSFHSICTQEKTGRGFNLRLVRLWIPTQNTGQDCKRWSSVSKSSGSGQMIKPMAQSFGRGEGLGGGVVYKCFQYICLADRGTVSRALGGPQPSELIKPE